jgi:NADH-quinone oxidoreductase subunit N
MHGFTLFLPETIVLVGALAVFIASVANRGLGMVRALALVASLGALAATLATIGASGEPFFPGIYRVDLFSQLVKSGLLFGLFVVLLVGRGLETIRADARVDTPLVLMLSTVGMMMLTSATELLTFYVALELSAYGLYVTVALHRDRKPGSEAGAKYVLFGAVASAATLYGLSLVMGTAGSTYLAAIADVVAGGGGSLLLTVGLVLVFAGLFFKLAVAPFHFWAPDVYEAAPHEVVTFVATVSKLAAVAVIARLTALAGLATPTGFVWIFGVLAVASMTLGNLAAIAQRDVKRLLAYSAIAHAGYMLLGYGALTEIGLAAAIFYGIVYLAITLLTFVVVCALGEDGSNPSIEGLGGLWQRSPLLALLLLVAIFGLAGIPPTAGFAGKWFLFSAALESGHFALVLIAAINSTVALYYYLLVIRAAYLAPAEGRPPLVPRPRYVIAGTLAAVVVLVAGVYPGPLWALAREASARLVLG